MKRLIAILLTCALFFTLVNGEISKTNKNKVLWQKQNINSYILVQNIDKQVQKTFVEDGTANSLQIDQLRPESECILVSFDLRTIKDIFKLVTDLQEKYGKNLKVKYHPELGYPQKIGIKKKGEIACLLEVKELIVMMD